jgi:hypothetical protein
MRWWYRMFVEVKSTGVPEHHIGRGEITVNDVSLVHFGDLYAYAFHQVVFRGRTY